MVFSSITFLIYFLPITIFLYYVAPVRLKNTLLLAASLFFYAWGEPIYIFLMIFSIVVNYAAGICFEHIENKIKCAGDDSFRLKRAMFAKKAVIAAAVAVNILLLGFFKYADFLISGINMIFGLAIEPLELSLPVGISFYTFQAVSYLVDVQRGNVKVQKNIIDFAMYISMFAQLIAGPIIRLADIECSLHRRTLSLSMFADGSKRFTVGLAKKALLANGAGALWEAVCEVPYAEMSVLTAWIGIIGFTFQIYFDFSGYSDMAIGLGKMLGFDFPENFRYPYTSRSVTEFWRRWHISLGSWFREYVYIPLGGSRCGALRRSFNILTVWLLTGLWHGASMNFVLWGLYFALLLVLEKAFLLRILEKLPRAAGHLYTMLAVIISWAIFALDTDAIIPYLKTMLGIGAPAIYDLDALYMLSGNALFFAVLAVGSTRMVSALYRKFFSGMGTEYGGKERAALKMIVENVCLAALLIISLAYVEASTYNPFLYFRF